MQILIAEDDPVSSLALRGTLAKWGYDVRATTNGRDALHILQSDNAPTLAILDWMMPEMDGLEVCRQARAMNKPIAPYLILLTAMGSKEDIVTGLNAGADDYLTKPFVREELQARLKVGIRTVELQRSLSQRVMELATSLAQVKQLQGLLPICSYCKRIRDDHNYWQQVEAYIGAHTDTQFTHGICPDCMENRVRPELASLRKAESAA